MKKMGGKGKRSRTTSYGGGFDELKSRRFSRRRTETTPFDEVTSSTTTSDVTVCSSNDVPVSCCSNNATSSSTSSSSSSSSVSGEFSKNFEVESGGETPLKFDDQDCNNKSARGDNIVDDDDDEVKSKVEMKSASAAGAGLVRPSDSEIEDFFSAAEKDLQTRFSNKYNFDVVKDVPLEGRYEWVEIKP